MNHHHEHHHASRINYNKRFFIGATLNFLLVVFQIFYGLRSNSVALISDAFHNASDVLALVIAWGGFHLATLKTSEKYTYGLKNTTILAAFINAALLFAAVGGICWEAINRLYQPPEIKTQMVLIVAMIAVIINGLTALMFFSGSKDINIRGAFLHMAQDAAISLGVIIAALVIAKTEWFWIDPLVSIIISIFIILGSWRLFKESISLILHAVPDHINLEQVRSFLLAQSSVIDIHDLHIWAISTTETAMSVHLVVNDNNHQETFLPLIIQQLNQQFHIGHCTIQIENQHSLQKCDLACESSA